jgi:UDP-glucose 4-epimerase
MDDHALNGDGDGDGLGRGGTVGAGRQVSPSPSPIRGAVLVTGVGSRFGTRSVKRLHNGRERRRVIGIDRRNADGLPEDIEYHRTDLLRRAVQQIFRREKLGAVVHLGLMHDARVSGGEHHSSNVLGFQRLLEHAAKFAVRKLVVLSSARAYGPRPDNAQYLTEEAPLLGGAAFSGIHDAIEIDMLAQSFLWQHPEIETVILRPVHVLGSLRNAASNYLRLDVIPTLMGFDPLVQVVHQDDVTTAIEDALRPGVRGVFNIAGPPPLPLSELVALTGRARVAIPHVVAQGVLGQLWRFGATTFPAPEVHNLRYVCMVDDRRARGVLGYAPAHDVRAAVQAIDEPA